MILVTAIIVPGGFVALGIMKAIEILKGRNKK